MPELKIRRALLSVSDKDGVVELGRALAGAGAELIATGKTAALLKEAGLAITPIESVTGNPEAFGGRMKTLSFPVFSGILYRRGMAQDEADLKRLGFAPVDCVVVNFYPFEKAAARDGITEAELVEEIDIGGPSMVRAAAKNAPDVLVLTSRAQYASVIGELRERGTVTRESAKRCAAQAWDRVLEYDRAIAGRMGAGRTLALRYGENPHQQGELRFGEGSPVAWPSSPAEALTPTELSYNNILDFSAAYGLTSDLVTLGAGAATGAVIVKHGNPCGVSLVPRGAFPSLEAAQLAALTRAWEGDPVSAFGGVVLLTDALQPATAGFLAERFVELVAAPGLDRATLAPVLARRKNLKALCIRRFGELPSRLEVSVPGGVLAQTPDTALAEPLVNATKAPFPAEKEALARFGIAVCRSLKSNAIALVREIPGLPGGCQLIGAGQGQPNRIEALKWLAVPRARNVLGATGGSLADVLMVSDAFFPFRDTVDAAHEAGLRWIIQPGGSVRDAESVKACDEHGIAMVFTGTRHFKH